MNRAEMLAELTKAGITLAADATDAAVVTAFKLHCMKAAPEQPKPLTAADITKLVGDVLAPVLEKLKAKATDNMGDPSRSPITGKEAADGSGINFARFVKAQAESSFRMKGGVAITPVAVLREWGYKELADRCDKNVAEKSFAASVSTEGGALVPEDVRLEVIELLRDETAVRALGARVVDMPRGNYSQSRQTGASTFQWVGEGVVPGTSKPALDGIKMSAKKAAGVVIVSNDTLRFASINSEEMVRQDMIQGLGIFEDQTLISNVGGQYSPIGLLYLVAAGSKYNATAVAPKVPTLTEVRAELAKLPYQLKKNKQKERKGGYILSPRTEWFLGQISDGLGNPVYRTEMATGKLNGRPFVVTTSIPENLGGGTDESKIYFADFDEILIGDAMGMAITVSPDGSYEEGGVVKAGFSRDETPIRIIEQIDQTTRHNTAIAIVEAIRWGAP